MQPEFEGVGAAPSAASPLISVVTVVLNGAKTLEATLRSVLDQGFEDLDYVVIDGGSTDGSLDIIRRYESRLGHWRSEADKGLYDAMNKGLRAAKGRWVLFLGADDVLVASLAEIAPLLKAERTVYYGDVFMTRRQRVYDGRFSAYKIMFANICQQAIFYPREVFDVRQFDTRYKLWADYVLNMACYGDRRFRFVYIGKLVCVYNDYSGATAYNVDAKFETDRELLIRTHLPLRLFVAYWLRTRTRGWKTRCLAAFRRWLGW
jgi:glycosyltransferase involved in cell wall biosynthesis